MDSPQVDTHQVSKRDPTFDAAAGIVWLIVLNKPFYPFYVWWITGHGLGPAFLSGLSAPIFAALLPGDLHALALMLLL